MTVTPSPSSLPSPLPSPVPSPEPSPAPLPVALVCEPGYAPGWLDESGNPTSCVYNGPGEFHSPDPVETSAGVVDVQSAHLAETGATTLPVGLVAALLIAAGAGLVRWAVTR